MRLMRHLVNEQSQDEKPPHFKFRVRAVIYIDYLIKMNRMPKSFTQSESELSEEKGIPLIIARNLIEKFTETTIDHTQKGDKKFKHLKSKKCVDKLICHFIVLLLIIQKGHL